jgi:molybdopterin converting factor small subunit
VRHGAASRELARRDRADCHRRIDSAAVTRRTKVEVNEGVKDGDKVILQPPVNLADGNKVQIIPEPPAATP